MLNLSYIKNSANYVEQNLISIEIWELKGFLWATGYDDLEDFLVKNGTEVLVKGIDGYLDGMVFSHLAQRIKNLERKQLFWSFMTARSIKLGMLEMTYTIFRTIIIMILNFHKKNPDISKGGYLKILCDLQKSINYTEFRFLKKKNNIFGDKYKKYIDNEIDSVRDTIFSENIIENIQVIHQFNFLGSDQVLSTIALRLEEMGYIENAVLFKKLFYTNNSPGQMPENKIIWRYRNFDLAYLFRLMLSVGLLPKELKYNIFATISKLFISDKRKKITGKSLGSSLSKKLIKYPCLFEGSPKEIPTDAKPLFLLIRKYSVFID